jgi:hypothetical protein
METTSFLPNNGLPGKPTISLFDTAVWKEHYTSDDAWLPFALPFLMWTSCWIYARIFGKKDHAKWYSLHTLHHVGAILQASLSLHYNDNTIFHEQIPIFWSMGYFILDIVDCLYMGHILYTAHGLVCLLLGFANYNVPLLKELRMNSKATYIETSSILLYQVKQYRKPWLFVIFAITYTCCRILWIPCMMKELLDNGMEYTNVIFILLVLFYLLQIHWWVKILKILVSGDKEAGSASEKEKKEE